MALDTSASSRAIEVRLHLDDGDLGAEPPEHLRELEPDVRAAHHHQVLGQAVERQDRAVVEVRDLTHARHAPGPRHVPHVDEDARRRQHLVTDAHLRGRFEGGVPVQHRAAAHAAQPVFDAGRARRPPPRRPAP